MILSDIFFWRSIWHLFWHSVSHIFWHSDRHSIVSRRGFRSRRAWLHPALAIVFGSLRAQLYPELAIWLGSIDAHSHDELAEEEMRRKKRTRRRSCTFVKIYIVTLTSSPGRWENDMYNMICIYNITTKNCIYNISMNKIHIHVCM